MAISRMQIPRQLRAGGGIMTLEEPRQGFFLGKIVKKAKRAVKKVVKSPLGKLALGAAALKFGGPGIAKLLGRPATGFLSGQFTGPGGILSAAKGLFGEGKFLGSLVRDKAGVFSPGRAALLGLGAAGIAAPFLMGGGDEDEGEPETPYTQTPDSISSIVNMARNQDPSLRFLPKPKFVDNFYAADGGLADIPTRQGYKFGEMVEGIETVANDENMEMAGMGNVMRFFENNDGSFDRAGFEDMLIQYEDSGAKANGVKLMDFAMDFLGISSMKDGGVARLGYNEGESVLSKEQMAMISDMKNKGMDMSTIESMTGATADQITNYLSSLNKKQEGGLMDLGGLEKDYREGGFVPLGAEERADDVPARLSKNEFVFTADAVRNAGQGDIDKGAEVMQNMMDNLEAGGTISEESQGMNPAQEMFDQSQMLEGRLA